MPKVTQKAELAFIKEIISHYPNGIKIDELLHVNEITLPRRTLQRRLSDLIKEGRISVIGKGASCRYQSILSEVLPYDGFQISLSDDAQLIRAYVNQPLEKRNAVNYNRQFLEAYQPNETYYLTPAIRAHLKAIGSHAFSGPLAGTYARKILSHLLIDLSWNSSRLEGNTYSLLETERLLAFGEESESKSPTDTQMILNHKAAIEFLVEFAAEITFNRSTILNLHALLSDNLLGDSGACGRLRSIPVGISKTTYSPLNIPQLIDEMFQTILDKASAIQDPFEKAFFVMVHCPYLQPFEDVNKRVSRLAANIPLIQNNLSPLSFIDLPDKAYIDGILGVYELNKIELLRDVFVWAYERSAARYTTAQQILGEPNLFKMKYRKQLITLISDIVHRCLDAKESIHTIQTWIETNIQASDQARFREVAETELLNLHAGNAVRFHLKPSEFEKWQEQYQKPATIKAPLPTLPKPKNQA